MSFVLLVDKNNESLRSFLEESQSLLVNSYQATTPQFTAAQCIHSKVLRQSLQENVTGIHIASCPCYAGQFQIPLLQVL